MAAIETGNQASKDPDVCDVIDQCGREAFLFKIYSGVVFSVD